MEDGFYELVVDLVWHSGIEKCIVNVCRPVIESRKEETKFRLRNDLTGHTTVEFIIPGEKAQFRFSVLDRADAAENVAEYLVGSVWLEIIVFAPVRHIVDITGQENQIVAVLHLQGVNDNLIEFMPNLRILQFRIPHGSQQTVFIAVHHLLCREHNVNQVAAKSAGKPLLQKTKILLCLLLRHGTKGFVQIGDDLFVAVYIAPVDAADSVFIGAKAATKFTEFFYCHADTPLIVVEFCRVSECGVSYFRRYDIKKQW